MRAFFLLPVAWLGLGAPSAAQDMSNPLMERIAGIDPATATSAACEAEVAKADAMNAYDMFYGAAICSGAKQPVEASFLMLSAQNRAMADMSLIAPATKKDSDTSVALYGFIYFAAGGPGDEQVLRDPVARARLFGLLDKWSPTYDESYDPGWTARRRPDAAAYRKALDEMRADRRTQIDRIARLYADAIYSALNRELNELSRRTGGSFEVGTPDYALSQSLTRRMAERAHAMGLGPPWQEPEPIGEAHEQRFPPPSPAADERAIANPSGEVLQKCTDYGERWAIALDGKILRVLVTESAEWGIIWRADMKPADRDADRLTCTANFTGSHPLEDTESIERAP